MNKEERINELDTIRVVACLLVCMIHSPIPIRDGVGNFWVSAFNYFSSPCIGLFFMLSGALLFPVKKPLGEYVMGKLKRIGIPLLFWSLIAISIQWFTGDISGDDIIPRILSIPFGPVEGVYWFMYVILGLFLFAPLLSPALEKLANVKYMLILWLMSLCLPYANAWVPGCWDIRGGFYNALSLFGGYMGYMVLGHYLMREVVPFSYFLKRYLLPILALAIGVPLFFIGGRYGGVPNTTLYSYLSINVAGLSVLYFVMLRSIRVPKWGTAILQEMASKTFGIYLIHIFVMRQFLWFVWEEFFAGVSYAVQIPVTTILTFILSYLIVKALLLIPGAKYIF